MRKYTLLLVILLANNFLFAQTLQTALFQNVNIKGKVIQLELAPAYADAYFSIGLVKGTEVISNTGFVIAGSKFYDIRQLDAPQQIDVIATTLPEAAILSKRLIEPSIGQEFAILFSRNVMSPRTVNFVNNKTFLGYRFTLILLCLVLLGFLVLRFGLKKSYWKAALMSSLVGFVLTDLISINDHIDTVQQVEKNHPYLNEIAPMQRFVERAKPKMEGGTLNFVKHLPDPFQELFLRYNLADIRNYKRRKQDKKQLPKGMFVITTKAANHKQKLIEAGKGFYLLQKK